MPKTKRLLAVLAISSALWAGTMAVASADPDFGTGNSEKKTNDPGAVCSPSPVLDADLPQCK